MLAIEQILVNYVESSKPFPIDFEDYFLMLGYTQKSNAKRSFLTFPFEIDEDYQIINKFEKPGRPREEIRLTVDCAKLFAFLSGTPRSTEIYRLFLSVEKYLIKCRKDFATNVIRAKQDVESRNIDLTAELKIARAVHLRDNLEEIERLKKENASIRKEIRDENPPVVMDIAAISAGIDALFAKASED
jgi:phage anti-repressor protein